MNFNTIWWYLRLLQETDSQTSFQLQPDNTTSSTAVLYFHVLMLIHCKIVNEHKKSTLRMSCTRDCYIRGWEDRHIILPKFLTKTAWNWEKFGSWGWHVIVLPPPLQFRHWYLIETFFFLKQLFDKKAQSALSSIRVHTTYKGYNLPSGAYYLQGLPSTLGCVLPTRATIYPGVTYCLQGLSST